MRVSKTLSWLALGGVALTLTACGGGDQKPTTDAQGNTVIKYWHAYSADSPEIKTLEDKVIPAFEKSHPGIKVESVPYPYDDLHQKLLTATAGGTLPCLVRSDIIWVPELAKLGTIAPLSDEMTDFDKIASTTYDGALATTEYDGKHYGLPLDTNTRVLMYNQATLQEAGMSKPPATFDDMRKLADGLKGTGDYAFADNGTSGWNLMPWIWSAGGDLANSDMTKATGYLNSPQSVAGVQLLVDLYKEGELPDIITGAKGGEETSVGLPKGDYATMLDGPWMLPIFASQNPDFQVQTAMMPAGPGGSISVVGGEDVVMTNSCPSKGDAEQFIRFLLSDEAQKDMAEVGQMPVLSTLGSQLTDIKPYYGIFAKQLETARPRLPHPEYPKIETILSTEVQKAFTGDTTVQAALDSAAKQIDGILASS
ncbi:extracellular solute-binding protein [Nocardioides panaciterrulae]|uniref:Multiple sugar transport system substrate-binding protein n=1 Tax=Nocardioides panaciterrulae TaxID=661492 RepID=A0A7Y9J923_9ACTN|nr:extracellular solute-binding protein [Nocardioides panaciterrulae]NYD40075.1 multiple sugar transport system substrate-binding protein [Nocardioides panaciterrulae]